MHTCTRHRHTGTRADYFFVMYQLETRFARINGSPMIQPRKPKTNQNRKNKKKSTLKQKKSTVEKPKINLETIKSTFKKQTSSSLILPTIVCRKNPLCPVLFERSEFLIATCKKKKTDRPDVCTHNLLVLVWKNCLRSSVRSGNRKRPKHGIPLPVQIHSF